jgi:hypothetical protein
MNREESTRLEEFRQFRKEVRGSSEYLLVGIDVAKDKKGEIRRKTKSLSWADGIGLS